MVFGLLAYTGVMFNNYIRSQEIKLIEKNIYYDSLIHAEQVQLKEKDSIILAQQHMLKEMLSGHANQLYYIKNKVNKMEMEETK